MDEEFEIIFFKKEDGTSPVKDFILSLEDKMAAKTMRFIGVLKAHGPELREPYTKPLEDGIFELRIQQGNNISRVLYFFVSGKKIILTNGFIKKTQKTPRREILLAKKYQEEFKNKH